MNEEQFEADIRTLQKHIALLKTALGGWEESSAALEEVQIMYEEMLTTLEAAETLQEALIQQNQRTATAYQYYYDLFHSAPVAYLITDAQGIILNANQAIAQLLNVPQNNLFGQSFALYIQQREGFQTQLAHKPQILQVHLCPRERESFKAQLQIDPVLNHIGVAENLRIGVFAFNQATVTQSPAVKIPTAPSSKSLDGVQVLVVDDEADVREFITAILEPHGIGVRAVASADAALETLEQFQPDVLVSDIRMPGEDGYHLIQRIRALEAQQGRHIPAAAITAYLDEDREKALNAGFEAYLHKLAQPIELVELVAQLSGRILTPESYDR